MRLDPVREPGCPAARWVGIHVSCFPAVIMPGIWVLKLGPAQEITDELKRETISLAFVLASAARPKAWSKDTSLSRFVPCLSSPSLVLSLNPMRLPLWLRTLRFKGFLLLRRGSACGLKIDVDGVQLTSKAARFRVASRSDVLSVGMARIGAAKDHDGRTLDSCARSWDDMYLHSSTAHFTAAASRLVNRMDGLQSLRDLPFDKMQSRTALMIRKSGNLLGSASAICSRSNCVHWDLSISIVSIHHSLMKGLCRTARAKLAFTAGAVRIACNGRCTAARFHSADENPGCLLGCSEGLYCDCLRHYNQCPSLFRSLLAIWPGDGECISPTAIFNDLLFATRNDRCCILVSGLLYAFVTAFHLRRTHQGHSLNFRELTYGRIKIMTVLCPAWAHTYQTLRLGFCAEQKKAGKFQVTQTQEEVFHFALLPNYYQDH